MRHNTECVKETLDTVQEKSTLDELGGDPCLDSESSINTYYCDTVEEFRKLEEELGVAARWTVPRKDDFAPDWESRWRWQPEDGLGWCKHGTDVY